MARAPLFATLNYGDRAAPEQFPDRNTKVRVEMLNGRQHGKVCAASGLPAKLDAEGFCLVTDAPVSMVESAEELQVSDVVDDKYTPFIQSYLQRSMGCHSVIPINHVHRKSGASQAIPDGFKQDVPQRGDTTGAIANVHADYTSDALLVKNMRQLVEDDPATKGGRFALVNCWRPLNQVRRWPLAVCDATSVVDEEDLYRRDTPENNNAVSNAFPDNALAGKHRWYYFPDMSPEEFLIFKQWDEDMSLQQEKPGVADYRLRGVARQTLHSAFDLPAPPDAPVRWSLESRYCCIWKPDLKSSL